MNDQERYAQGMAVRRAVLGELIHFRERMNRAVATRYVISMMCSLRIIALIVSSGGSP